MICIIAYAGISVFALFMSSQTHFWILAVCVGMCQGGIQALSRSHFAKLVLSEKTGDANKGVGILTLIFIAGFGFFYVSVRKEMQFRT